MDVIGLRMFPLSLMGEDVIWFTELPYNSIYTWNQFRDVFLARYYLVSKKLNHKDRVKKILELPGESVTSSWYRFTSFLRSVPITASMMSHRKSTSIRDKIIMIKQYWI